MELIKNNEVPIGFSMALAKDMNALSAFSSMNKEEQKNVINRSRDIRSKEEMQQYVSSIASTSLSTF